MKGKRCVLYDRLCVSCGECDICDLDENKSCDNCGKCIESAKEFEEIIIEKIILGNESE